MEDLAAYIFKILNSPSKDLDQDDVRSNPHSINFVSEEKNKTGEQRISYPEFELPQTAEVNLKKEMLISQENFKK